MKYIKLFKNFKNEVDSKLSKSFTEALLPSQFRKYTKEFNRERYADIFKRIGDEFEHDRNYYRVYIPLEKSKNIDYISDTHKGVEKYLSDNDCTLIDYVKGQAKFNNSKNITTIGKILTRLGNEELMKLYISDEKRKSITSTEGQDLYVVISRHPYDIAGSDTDRDWTNCMTIGTDKSNRLTNLLDKLKNAKETEDIQELKDKIHDYKKNGQNVHYLIHEVKEGSLISYLIEKDDKNINKPLAVLNIKPYKSDSGETMLNSSPQMYGIDISEFKSTVDNILDEYFNKDNPTGKYYHLNKKVYSDTDQISKYVFNAFNYGLGTEETLKVLNIKNYKIDDDGLVNVEGDVNIRSLITKFILDKIPVKFGNVTGSFECNGNKLTSLEGAPKSVGGNFDCRSNQLTSLEGAPKSLGGDFDCGVNKLTSLEGSPIKVKGVFNCNGNNLISLKGSPESVSDFDCGSNQLTSLEGGPIKVKGTFNCSDNNLISLKGSPESVGDFDCSQNKLTSLEGGPIKVKGDFSCQYNQLTSLKGGPLKVSGRIYSFKNSGIE